MRVMVTGATTPLGAAIVEHLLASRDVELLLAVGRERETPTSNDRLVYRSADLTRSREVHDLLWGDARTLGISAVIHTMQHRSAHDSGRRVHAQNVDATRELVVACSEHPTIRRFVYRSFSDVYGLQTQDLVDENAPLDFNPGAPAWVRDRVEADLSVCAQLGGSLEIAVLRCAEVFAPDCGSQLWDYLGSRVCLRPLGFDPMLNLLSIEDAARAFGAALEAPAIGVFNIPGYDTLPLSRVIAESVRLAVAVPERLMSPLYRLRHAVTDFEFRYDVNARRFHYGGVLDGRRAREAFGYVPRTPVQWPRPWWRRLIDELARTQTETTSQ